MYRQQHPPRQTCDGDFCRPLWGTIENWLLDGFHMAWVALILHAEHFPVYQERLDGAIEHWYQLTACSRTSPELNYSRINAMNGTLCTFLRKRSLFNYHMYSLVKVKFTLNAVFIGTLRLSCSGTKKRSKLVRKKKRNTFDYKI